MKTRWLWLSATTGAAAALAFTGSKWSRASMLEWKLLNRVPTASVRDSKSFGVFSHRLAVSPKDVDLGGKRYRIRDVWLEHRTEPRRISPFFTHQEIHRDLVLCVDVGPFDSNDDIQIKDAKTSRIFSSAVNGVKLSEVGMVPPKSFVLCTRDKRSEVVIHVENEPNPEGFAAP